MVQILFNPDTTPQNADLDANFTELYGKTAWATTGIGYATGAGGTVTQATSKSTAVILNKLTGAITMNAASLAGSTSISFQLTNSTIVATDVVSCALKNGTGAGGAYLIQAQADAGAAVIHVRNLTGGALAEAIVISFIVLKAQTT